MSATAAAGQAIRTTTPARLDRLRANAEKQSLETVTKPLTAVTS